MIAEHQLLHSSGGSTEETLRARISADIIVDPGLGEDEDTGAAPRTVRSLATALSIAKDGDKIFLEEGRHTRAQGWQVGGHDDDDSDSDNDNDDGRWLPG